MVLSADQNLLFVADFQGQRVFSFQVQADGSLLHWEPFFQLHVPQGALRTNADGMTVDTERWLYVATTLGSQVLDRMGGAGEMSRRWTA